MSKFSTIKKKIKPHLSAIGVGVLGLIAVVYVHRNKDDHEEIDKLGYFPTTEEGPAGMIIKMDSGHAHIIHFPDGVNVTPPSS